MSFDVLEQIRETKRLPPPAVARGIRRAAGVTQRAMASTLGVNRVTVARWESGTRRPRGELRAAYASLLRELHDAVNPW